MTQRFGGRNTAVKLGVIERYLQTYQSILSKQSFRTSYVDAFAGTGRVAISKADDPVLPGLVDAEEVIKGSAYRALELPRPFSRYLFVERSPAKLAKLKGDLEASFPGLKDRLEFEKDDANRALGRFCDSLGQRDRAVVFLDPFGNQVNWATIERLASTRAVDLWYLFPSGLGVSRQISRDGRVHEEHVQSLNRVLGTRDWPKSFLRQEEGGRDLFGHPTIETYKTAGAEEITRYVMDRMKPIFAGGVADAWLPLGSRNVNWYSLIFACANPRGGQIATKVARWLIDRAR